VNPVLAKRRQSGALLLTVSLLLAVMAALAFGLNRAGGMEANAVTADYDQRNAAYLAEAAVAAAKWKTQLNNKCANVQIPAFTFGDGSISAAVKDSGAKHIDVTASATTAAGSVVSLTRTKLDIVNFASPETKDLGGAVQATYVDRLNTTTSFGTGTGLVLTGGQTNVLLSWDTKDIPADAEVMSASLMLTQDGGSPTARTVNVHRVTTQWDANASWSTARPATPWSGGDYSPATIASAAVTTQGVYTWNVTSLVDGWNSGRLAKYGMLLRIPVAGQSATFFSKEASGSQRPILRVTFAKPC
jgi:Tfp pilus assembly protein PilX